MASKVVEKIIACLEQRKSFVLDAGAGSGKTQTLIHTLEHILKNKNRYLSYGQRVACLTFTNVAVKEIIDRTDNSEHIFVSTLHKFAWQLINQFQSDMIIQLYGDSKSNQVNEIKYKNYSSLEEGIISHNEVIEVTAKMFASYPRLARIAADMFPIILVDEYQDTNKAFFDILMKHILPTKRVTLGFYGDKMQHIYGDGIGEIGTNYPLERITKYENYRCPVTVINLLNNIRDDFKQEPGKSGQEVGSCKIYIRPHLGSVPDFIKSTLLPSWGLHKQDYDKVKQLYLTHTLIAKENDYDDLLKVYGYTKTFDWRNLILRNHDNRGLCPWADYLTDICEVLSLYKEGQMWELLHSSPLNFAPTTRQCKIDLNNHLTAMINMWVGVLLSK